MRADRLISIVLLLQANGRMTAETLADRLEVSQRGIGGLNRPSVLAAMAHKRASDKAAG